MATDSVVHLKHPGQRSLEHLVARRVDARRVDDGVHTQVDETERAEHVEPLVGQHCVLSTASCQRRY